jgi:hypothetical protein
MLTNEKTGIPVFIIIQSVKFLGESSSETIYVIFSKAHIGTIFVMGVIVSTSSNIYLKHYISTLKEKKEMKWSDYFCVNT